MPVLEIFGLILAISAAIPQLKQTADLVRDHCQAFVENNTNMTRVISLYDSLALQLERFAKELSSHGHRISPFSLAFLTYEFRMVNTRIERATRELRDITTRGATSSRMVNFLRSRKVKQDWEELEKDADRLMHAIRHMSITCTVVDIAVNCCREQNQIIVQELNKIRQAFFQGPHARGDTCTHHEDIMEMPDFTTFHSPQRSLRDIDMNFTCTIHCPENPPYVYADFKNPGSPESRLLSCILREGHTSPDIYNCRKIELTGKGGRGKTCILRSLCTNQTIVSRYTGAGKGGIYYMNLGHDPTANDVRHKLYEMIESSGGAHLREKILGENISMCILRLVDWFKHKDTLFLIDEAYDETDLGAEVTKQIRMLSMTSGSSAVVFSRRKSRFSVGEIVRLYPEGESESRKLLLSSAGLNAEKEITDMATKEALDSVVDMCHGNIRLLGQAGVWYKHLPEKVKREGGWGMLAERLRLRLGDGEDENEAQDVLIGEILTALQAGIGRKLKRATSVHRMYRALHCVKRREWIAVNELCKVWGLECWECVIVAEFLLRGRLCRISERIVGGELMRGVEIHDCLWEYMWREAVKHGEVAVTA